MRSPSLMRRSSTTSSSNSREGVLRHAPLRSLHCTVSAVPKARKITFASDVFSPVQQPRSRLDIWGPEEFDIGHTVPMRAACSGSSSNLLLPSTPPYGSPDNSPPKSKKVPQTVARLEARLHKVMTRVSQENVVLQELRDEAYELKVENELTGLELVKCDLIQENDVKIAALICDLQRTVDKYTSKIKSRRKKIESCERKTKKLSMTGTS